MSKNNKRPDNIDWAMSFMLFGVGVSLLAQSDGIPIVFIVLGLVTLILGSIFLGVLFENIVKEVNKVES
jgi:hypothetical protein